MKAGGVWRDCIDYLSLPSNSGVYLFQEYILVGRNISKAIGVRFGFATLGVYESERYRIKRHCLISLMSLKLQYLVVDNLFTLYRGGAMVLCRSNGQI